MKQKLYSKDELKLLKSIENEPNKWKSVSKKEKLLAMDAAKEYLKNKKGKRITIRINEQDLYGIQKIAKNEGIPYQTYIAGLLHKMAQKRLVDKEILDELLSKLKAA